MDEGCMEEVLGQLADTKEQVDKLPSPYSDYEYIAGLTEWYGSDGLVSIQMLYADEEEYQQLYREKVLGQPTAQPKLFGDDQEDQSTAQPELYGDDQEDQPTAQP